MKALHLAALPQWPQEDGMWGEGEEGKERKEEEEAKRKRKMNKKKRRRGKKSGKDIAVVWGKICQPVSTLISQDRQTKG